MNDLIPSLSLARMNAAIASGGTSSNEIHAAALRALGLLPSGSEILEFGAGTGALMLALRQVQPTLSLSGTDILHRPENLPSDIKWHQSDLNETLALPSHSFDAVVSTEVIEHLENPRAIAREIARLLKPNGKIILTTPNQESFRSLLSLLLTGHYVAFQDTCYPAHITALLRKDLLRIFSEAGFTEFNFTYTDCGGIPKIPFVTWQQVSFGLLRGRFFSDNLIMTAHI